MKTAEVKNEADRAQPNGVPTPQAFRFFAALFRPDDHVLFRFIESWTDTATGKKGVKVAHDRTRCYPARYFSSADLPKWENFLAGMEEVQLSLFFGVLPRFGQQGYDLAWQIRRVPSMYSDMDGAMPEEALARVEKAGLPPPSILVNSGNGCHLYWLLEEAYLIDDAGGDPPQVKKDWALRKAGLWKRPREYVKVDGHRVYHFLQNDDGTPTKRPSPEWPMMSPKAQHAQDVLAGIASAIGGDHTHDLARLLRVPGIPNRKNGRNGAPPKPCELILCEPSRRYPLSDFERFAEQSPHRRRREEVAKAQLKSGVSLGKRARNKLVEVMNAGLGMKDRSRADHKTLCHCVRQGHDQEKVWEQVKDTSKFAERGRGYFDLSWASAVLAVKTAIYLKAHGEPARAKPAAGQVPALAIDDPHALARAYVAELAGRGGAIVFFREDFHVYDGRRYVTRQKADVKARLANFCRREIDRLCADDPPDDPIRVTAKLVSDVWLALAGEVLVTADTPWPSWLGDEPGPRNWIALANGILDVDAWLARRPDALLNHDRLWFSPVCLPYPFDPTAKCPRWSAFLARNLGGEKGALLGEWAGYTLTIDTTRQKALVMAGEGANGKSVALAGFEALLGEDNISTVPLEQFGDKFKLSTTLGKLANVCSEVGELDKIAEGNIKAFTVGDPMQFEAKFKTPFRARPTARLMLATNNVPKFSDKSEGIWRRLLLLPFTVVIEDKDKVEAMTTPAYWRDELPGMLNWALEGLRSLRDRGRFEVPKCCDDALKSHREDSNPARRYLLECYQESQKKDDPDQALTKNDVYQSYRMWCATNGHHPLASNAFGKEVARAFKGVKDGRRPKPPRHTVYLGLESVDPPCTPIG